MDRQAIEGFLSDLTKLTRKYGLVVEEGSYMSYGETYEYLNLDNLTYGTESYYYVDDDGVQFGVPGGKFTSHCDDVWGVNPECDDIVEMERVKALRSGEAQKDCEETQRQNAENWRLMKEHREAQLEQCRQEYAPPPPTCRCGKEFNTERGLSRHTKKTGHTA